MEVLNEMVDEIYILITITLRKKEFVHVKLGYIKIAMNYVNATRNMLV